MASPLRDAILLSLPPWLLLCGLIGLVETSFHEGGLETSAEVVRHVLHSGFIRYSERTTPLLLIPFAVIVVLRWLRCPLLLTIPAVAAILYQVDGGHTFLWCVFSPHGLLLAMLAQRFKKPPVG